MRVSYLVAVYGVLGRPGGDGDGVWLAAAVSLTVSIFASLPAQTHTQNEMSSVLRSLANSVSVRKHNTDAIDGTILPLVLL